VLQNFLRMNTWTDPVRNSGFFENWTVFYWAWWIAYGPFVGLFVTRISRGRSLREIILGMLGFGTLGAGIFYLVLGNYALHLDLAGLVDVTGIMAKSSEAQAIAAVIGSLPFGRLALFSFILVATVLLATTFYLPRSEALDPTARVAGALAIASSLVSLGGLLDRRAWAAPLELVRLGAREAAITRVDGCVAAIGEGPEQRFVEVRTEPLEPVSTVGSGDAFLAGYAAARYEGRPAEECLAYGVACGAESTQHFGAGVIERNQVERLLGEVHVQDLEVPAEV